MEQLILHLLGDYVFQSDWMAQNKTKAFLPAFLHAWVYSLPFLFLHPSMLAFGVILTSHFVIDRYRLARFAVYVKNGILSPSAFMDRNDCTPEEAAIDRELDWENCKDTGYPSQRPAWLAVWLLIACDNTIHLAINYAAIRWF